MLHIFRGANQSPLFRIPCRERDRALGSSSRLDLLGDCPRRYANVIGLAFGFALYSANFHGFTVLFPWFAEFRTVDTLFANLIFGFLLARAYCAFKDFNFGSFLAPSPAAQRAQDLAP